MRTRIIYSILLSFLSIHLSFGQFNMSSFYNNHKDINAAKLFQSELDLGVNHWQFGMTYDLWLGNNALTFGAVNDVGSTVNNTDAISNQQIYDIFNKFGNNSILGFGTDLQLIDVAYQFYTKSTNKRIDFTFSVDDKAATNLVFSENLAKLIWKGNAQFRGQNVELDPFAINANYTRSFNFGASFPIYGHNEINEIRGGVRLKYILGYGNISMTDKNFFLYTNQEGTLVNTTFDYDLKTSRIDKNFSPFNPSGKGFGADLSLTYFLNPNFEFAASVNDIGFVHYTKDAEDYQKVGAESYNGDIVSNIFGGIETNPHQLTEAFVPTQTEGGSYNVYLGTKLNLMAEYKQLKQDSIHGVYELNSCFLTYIQGFHNVAGATTNAFISAGYKHAFGNSLNLGISTSYGGFNGFVFGPFAGFKWKHTCLAIGSDNFGGLLFPHIATGVDFTLFFTVTI